MGGNSRESSTLGSWESRSAVPSITSNWSSTRWPLTRCGITSNSYRFKGGGRWRRTGCGTSLRSSLCQPLVFDNPAVDVHCHHCSRRPRVHNDHGFVPAAAVLMCRPEPLMDVTLD